MKKKCFLIPVAVAAAALTGVIEANTLPNNVSGEKISNVKIDKDNLTKDLLMLPNEGHKERTSFCSTFFTLFPLFTQISSLSLLR